MAEGLDILKGVDASTLLDILVFIFVCLGIYNGRLGLGIQREHRSYRVPTNIGFLREIVKLFYIRQQSNNITIHNMFCKHDFYFKLILFSDGSMKSPWAHESSLSQADWILWNVLKFCYTSLKFEYSQVEFYSTRIRPHSEECSSPNSLTGKREGLSFFLNPQRLSPFNSECLVGFLWSPQVSINHLELSTWRHPQCSGDGSL